MTLSSMAIVAIHMLLISVITGTAFENVWDGSVSIAYTNYVVRPLLYVFNLGIVGVILNYAAWGFLGWALFWIGQRITSGIRNWRSAEDDVMLTERGIVQHPLRESFIVRVTWQLGCIALFAILLVQMPGIIHTVSTIDHMLFDGMPFGEAVGQFLKAVVIIMVVEHIVVVLLRLYTFRTRLTDSPRYD